MSAHKFLLLLGLGQKKNNFVYFSGGETPSGGEEKIDAAKKKVEKEKAEYEAAKADLEKLEQEGRKEVGNQVAQDTAEVLDPIDEALKDLNQAKFDKFMEGLPKLDKALSSTQVDKLVDFAETSKEGRNFDKIFDAIDKDQITADQLSQNVVDKIINYYYKNEGGEKVKALTKKFTKHATTSSKLINTTKGNEALVKEIFGIIKANAEVFQKLDTNALLILVNLIGINEITVYTNDNQRAEILRNSGVESKNKVELYKTVMAVCENKISTLDSVLKDAVINYTFNENKVEFAKIRDQIDAATLAKLEPKDSDENTEEDPKSKVETLDNNSSAEQLLQAAGIEVLKNEKKIGWTFEVKSADGQSINSDRNFKNSKIFLNGLTEKDAEGNLINNTADKVKLFCYKYLLNIIEKDGSIETNKWKVTEFEKSNQMLKDEIARLSAATTGTEAAPAAATEPEAAVAKEPEAAAATEPEAVVAKEPEAKVAKEPEAKVAKEPEAVVTKEPEAGASAPAAAPTDKKVATEEKVEPKIETKVEENEDPNFTHKSIKEKITTNIGSVNGIDVPNNFETSDLGNNVILIKTDKLKYVRINLIDGTFDFYPQNERAQLTKIRLTLDSKQVKKGDKDHATLEDLYNEKFNKGKIAELAKEKKGDIVTSISDKLGEKLRARIEKKAAEIQTMADKIAIEETEENSSQARTIKLEKIATGVGYKIKIDGKETSYTVEFEGDTPDDKQTRFSIIDGHFGTQYAELSDEIVEKKIREMIKKTPNDQQVKSPEESIEELENEGFKSQIESTKPENLSVHQYQTLKKALGDIKVAIEEGKDAITIMSQLDIIGKNTSTILKDSSINKIKLGTKPALIWNPQKANIAFGDEEILLDRITEIKGNMLGKDSEEFKTFKDRSETQYVSLEDKVKIDAKLEEYKANYKTLTEKVYAVNLGSISEESMVKNWKKFNGYDDVESIMAMPPFLLNKENVRTVAAAMISEGSNEEVKFKDIFKFMEGFPNMEGKVHASLLKDSDAFLSNFDELIKLQESGKIDEIQATRLENMSTEILIPCIRLLEAFSQLKPIENDIEPEKTSEKQKETPEDQKKILEGLARLCSFDEKNSSGWENFIAKISGAKDKITMSDIDGKTFTVDKGKFKNRYSTKGALTIMENNPELYSVASGEKLFDKQKTVNLVNEMITLGFVNMVMEREGKKGKDAKPMTEILQSTEFKLEMMDYLISDFSKLNEKQIKAFQIGFMLKESAKFAEQIAEAKTALTEGDETMQNHPLFKQVASKLLDQGVSPDKIKKIQERLLFAGGLSFKNGKFEGGGLSVPFTIGDGLTAVIGLGATVNGDVIAGAALDIKVYRGEKVEASVVFAMGLQGVSAGARGTIKTEYVNLHGFAGAGWSWDKIIPTAGGSFGISWNMDAQLQRDIKEAEGKTDYTAAWNEWKKIPSNNIEAKYEAAKKIPQIWAKIGPLQAEFKLTNADVVHMLEGIKEQMTSDVLTNLNSPIPLFSYVGFGMLGPIPIPQIGIKLGSAKISVPNRIAIAKIMTELSDSIVSKKLKHALEQLDKGEKISVFQEQTGDIVYSREGKLLKLEGRDEVDLKGWETGIETYNTALIKAEIKLTQHKNNTIELVDLNPANKDVEIHIDPTLRGLALVRDKGKVFIEGNIDDLIITRERFSLPFEVAEDAASMRDVITIRQRSSVRGERDSSWIQAHEKSFLQRLEGDNGFAIYGKPQDNIKNIDKFGTSEKPEELDKTAAEFIAKRPQMAEKIDKNTIKTLTEKVKARRKAMKALDSKEYENQKPRKDLFKTLDGLFDSDKEFQTKFKALIDEPEKITALVAEYGDKVEALKGIGAEGHEKELNFAVTHLLNRHFTNVFQESTKKAANEEFTPKEIRALNAKVKKGMEKKINYVKNKVFIPEFQKTIDRMDPKPKMSAKEITEKLINDTYGELIENLKKPDFDFRQLKVETIPAGAMLVSGSRLYEKGKRKGAMAETVNYDTMPKAEALLHEFGFLEGTTGQYKLDSSDPKEKEMARVILEMASPIPKDDLEFLQSPLAMKIAGLQTHALLAYSSENGFEDYDKITEIYTDTSLLKTSESHKQALDRFKDLVKEIRKSQIEGTTIERKIGNTGLTVRLKMATDIVHGAYSKCTNLSAYIQEVGKIEVLKGNKTIAVFNSMNEVIDSELSKTFASFGIGVGFRSEKVAAKPSEPEAGSGGEVKQEGADQGGSSGTPSGQDIPSANNASE